MANWIQVVARLPAIFLKLRSPSLLFMADGLDDLQQRAPLSWLAVTAGLATWVVLGFLYWINARAYRRQEEAQRQPYAPPRPSGVGSGGASSSSGPWLCQPRLWFS